MRTMLLPLLALALALIGAMLVAYALRRRGGAQQWPYYARRVMTPPEQALYHRLLRALPDHVVLAQVQVSRALGVQKGHDFHAWNNRINRLSFDFLVCARATTPSAAIELDDKTHERADRREADARKTQAAAACGIPLHRWNVAALPDIDAIKAAIAPRAPALHDTTQSGEHRVLRLG